MRRHNYLVTTLALGALVLGACTSAEPLDPPGSANEVVVAPRPADRWAVYDPVRGGESVPVRFRPVLARDDILPVHDPAFVSADVVDWAEDSLVIGVELNNEARAYPVAFLNRREMVIDNHRGTPTLITWCPLCGTAMVHLREVDGKAVLFGNQGALFGNAMTWWDHDTGSIWSQPLGEAILGPRKGETLELLTSTITRWGDWRSAHPDTLALDAPNGLDSPNGRVERTLDEFVIVVELGGESVAFPISTLRREGVANEYVGGTAVAVVTLADTGQWAVFARELDDRTVELELVDGQLRESGGSALFDPILGQPSTGGQPLLKLPSFTAFPDDYPTFFPEGLIWTPDGLVPAPKSTTDADQHPLPLAG